MEHKYAIITGFMGKVQDRFADYQPTRTMEEMVKMASQVKSCKGLEVVFPQNFTDPVKLKTLLDNHGLETAILNLNTKFGDKFRFGSFSNPDKTARKEAVQLLKDAMDAAAILGCNMVTNAPLNDGCDYPFELNYNRAYQDTLECIREGASHRPDVRLSLEYKASEPRMHCLFNNAGKIAAFCEKVGLPNVGVTLDTGHAFLAGEVPADSLAFLHEMNRLFYIHINDNYRNWDWDMLPGTVNLWDFIEFAFYMKRVNYTGWITADVFPQRHNPIEIMQKTFDWMDFIFDLTDRIDPAVIMQKMNDETAMTIMDYVRDSVFGKK